MSDTGPWHIWLNKVQGPRARGERSLYFSRRRREPQVMVRVFAEGSGANPKHVDMFLTGSQARELAVWLVTNLMEERT